MIDSLDPRIVAPIPMSGPTDIPNMLFAISPPIPPIARSLGPFSPRYLMELDIDSLVLPDTPNKSAALSACYPTQFLY
jgi:hypothetical protein